MAKYLRVLGVALLILALVGNVDTYRETALVAGGLLLGNLMSWALGD